MQSNHQQGQPVEIKSRLFDVEKFQLGTSAGVGGKKFKICKVTPSAGTITLMIDTIYDSKKSLVGGFVRKQSYDEYGQIVDKDTDLPDAKEPEEKGPGIRPGEMGIKASGPCARAIDFPERVEEFAGKSAIPAFKPNDAKEKKPSLFGSLIDGVFGGSK